jgi:hypothetical protein
MRSHFSGTGGLRVLALATLSLTAATITTISLTAPAQAQSATTYASGNMWGTAPGGVSVTGATDSAIAHNQNSMVAGAVNAARKGLLIGNGPNMTISSIGSQSIISNTIIGNDNTNSVNANQSSSNSGSTSNQGTINRP